MIWSGSFSFQSRWFPPSLSILLPKAYSMDMASHMVGGEGKWEDHGVMGFPHGKVIVKFKGKNNMMQNK